MLKTFLLTVATTLTALPALASTIEVVWTGTIDFGTDMTGQFGTPTREMAGQNVTMTYFYDTDLETSYADGNYQALFGGTVLIFTQN